MDCNQPQFKGYHESVSLVSQTCTINMDAQNPFGPFANAVEQQAAFEALHTKTENEARKRQKTFHQKNPLLHRKVWEAMCPQDRAEFVELSEAVAHHGQVPIQMLCDRAFMPGKATVHASVHELNSAQQKLAKFAKGVHVASEEHTNRVLDFLTSLIDNSQVPDDVRESAVDVRDAFANLASAVDTRIHLPNVRFPDASMD
jgi:hypothetical protein